MKNINSQKNNNVYKYIEEHFEQFTNTEKRFVHFLLSNKFKAPFLSAYEIANRIKANSSTLIRFAKKIGFKGYPELQKNLGQLLVKEISYSSDLEKAKKFKEPKENNIIQISLNRSYSNMLELLKNADEQKIKLFSKKICTSRKKIVIANRGSYSTGHFIYFDFRNFELRIQASLADDPVLIEMFNRNFDLHSFTASLILSKTPSEVTDSERQKYKSISLGYWYGMGVGGIVNRTGLQRNFVKNLTETLDQKFKILRSRVTEYENEAKNKGYAETPWGRRMFKNAKRGYWALLAQATAADYFKYILNQVAEKLPELIISAPLFDGCLYKFKNDERKIENSIGELNEIVTQQVEKFCKMAVDIGFGKSWQEAVQSSSFTVA